MKRTIFSKRPISTDFGILILRVMAGSAMLTHGWPKLQRVIEGNWQFGDPIGVGTEVSLFLAVFAEFFCSILVILGLATRLATIPLLVTMSVAFFIVHSPDDFATKELAFLYLSIFLSIFFIGPGKFSLDKMM